MIKARFCWAIGLIATLAACQPPLIAGGPHSGVRALAVGMTQTEVEAILGPATDLAARPNGMQCISWVYDETISPKFILTSFQDGVLASAVDGYAAPCNAP